jgi:hypothetical protein
MPMAKLNPLKKSVMSEHDELPFPNSWDEVKAEVAEWYFKFGYIPKPKEVIDFLEERYLPPFKREKSTDPQSEADL